MAPAFKCKGTPKDGEFPGDPGTSADDIFDCTGGTIADGSQSQDDEIKCQCSEFNDFVHAGEGGNVNICFGFLPC